MDAMDSNESINRKTLDDVDGVQVCGNRCQRTRNGALLLCCQSKTKTKKNAPHTSRFLIARWRKALLKLAVLISEEHPKAAADN